MHADEEVRTDDDAFSDKDLDAAQDQFLLEEHEVAGVSTGDSSTSPAAASVGGVNHASEINDQVFEELLLEQGTIQALTGAWSAFLRSVDSREAAGEAIYAALFESAPSLQNLFKTPRAVMAMRFMNGLQNIVRSLDDPKGLKATVETLGFQHLDLEVTVPRVAIFRDAIIDLLSVELGEEVFNSRAREGWMAALNYVGGAFIYIRLKYTDRLRILASSWAIANNKQVQELDEEGEPVVKTAEEAGEGMELEVAGHADNPGQPLRQSAQNGKKPSKWHLFRSGQSGRGSKAEGPAKGSRSSTEGASGERQKNGEAGFRATAVPTTYNEMFTFNAAVMGFGNSAWMGEVLASFDTIVSNVSSSYRLQEECDVLSLRMAKYKGVINLAEYKAVMLASLRSLVPKDWNSDHEVAWSWLWENVERMLKSTMGKPSKQEKALEKLWSSLDESQLSIVRRQVYTKFFTLSPAGQDFFKQSSTRLDFIADRIVAMTLEIYKDPKKMVEDISALGLRHVGYGIPTELFGPFVTAAVQVIRSCTSDDAAEEAFRWSLSLISRILVRVINEGSTIVMKAINANSGRQLRRAVGCAPRGKRALWMLNVQVGTQSISPLLWAIQTGSLDAAKAMIIDLLTIRADRDHYYFGVDAMFDRHGDIVKQLCSEAPALLPVFLNGLIWRSRLTINGQRRVNYYVKHLLVDHEGNFSKALEWFTDTQDPKLICHPVLVLVTDLVWSRAAFRTFLWNKTWFLFTLAVFVLCQSIMEDHGPEWQRYVTFVGRAFVYVFSMGRYLHQHCKHALADYRSKQVIHVNGIPVPSYLQNWQDLGSLLLTVVLVIMLILEPILHCLGKSDDLFTELCDSAHSYHHAYSVFAMIAIVLYYSLIIDLSVFSTRISAFVLVCFRVLVEVALFIASMAFLVLTFSSAIRALDQENPDFQDIPGAALSLLKISLGMYSGDRYEALHESPALVVAVVCFLITGLIFLLNMLIAQLNSSYRSTYQDMLGLARLNRGKVVVETMPSVPPWRWQQFVDSLRLDEKLEFNEGDVGFAGGVQVLEPANANPTAVEAIRRFGGSTSPTMQWPAEDDAEGGDNEGDRFDKLEKLLHKVVKKSSSRSKHRKGGAGSSSAGQSGTSGSGAGSSQASEESSDNGD